MREPPDVTRLAKLKRAAESGREIMKLLTSLLLTLPAVLPAQPSLTTLGAPATGVCRGGMFQATFFLTGEHLRIETMFAGILVAGLTTSFTLDEIVHLSLLKIVK